MKEELKQFIDQFEDILNKTKNKPNKTYIGIQATNYLFSVMKVPDNVVKKTREMYLTTGEKMFINELKKISKHYEDKFYELAKPFIEDYYQIKEDTFSQLNASTILESFIKCEKSIKEEKVNPNHTEEIKGLQISIIKSFAYYINKEFEDKMDSKCRSKYYEILKL